MDKLAEVTLFVPEGREGCATWLKQQSPELVCHALSLAETAVQVIAQQKKSSDSTQLVEELRDVKRVHTEATRLERAASDAKEQRLQQEGQAREAALRAHNIVELQNVAADITKHSEQKRTILEAEMTKLLDERSAQHIRHDSETEQLRAMVARDQERKEEEHNRELTTLREEVRQKEGEESIKLADLARRYEDTRHRDTLAHEENVKQMHALQEREIGLLREMCASSTKREEECQSNMREIEHTNKTMLAECTSKLENVLTRSSTAIGRYGERLVMEVFADLNLGQLSDDRGIQAEGYADGTWTYEAPGMACKLQCLLEVKQVNEVLHSVKDLEKYDRDVRAAVMAGRVNCAVLISLAARVPGTKQLDMSTIQGIPVLRASRSADDTLPPDVLVRLAFTTMAEAWPFLCRAREEGSVEASMEAVVDHLDAQLSELDKISKRAQSLKQMGKKLEREGLELDKIRNRMLGGIETLRLNHPSLIPLLEAGPLDVAQPIAASAATWESVGGVSLLESFRTWRQERGGSRWPARLDQMELTPEAQSFATCTPNAFVLARDKVKDEIQRTKRRRTIALPEETAHESE